ncbi:hypothetical protein JMJ58_07630 [Haloterrigena salifodinae]|uniref:Uncharacterized protein n=1 Tax=Haloterrigena salifodinae TaxID=2675099 RepID=A0A8T8E4R0_9EURY|nr:hypothetical protein [Haloterrigena salifodinae]QRV16728.1 hypothetical protein JMJ58_07630 [Haloterrigena salifodinae]
MSGTEGETVPVTVQVEPEALVAIAARAGEEYRDCGELTVADVDQLVTEHFELRPVFQVEGVEQPIGEWLTENTHIELEGSQ